MKQSSALIARPRCGIDGVQEVESRLQPNIVAQRIRPAVRAPTGRSSFDALYLPETIRSFARAIAVCTSSGTVVSGTSFFTAGIVRR